MIALAEGICPDLKKYFPENRRLFMLRMKTVFGFTVFAENTPGKALKWAHFI
jgi:hypothetical protein